MECMKHVKSFACCRCWVNDDNSLIRCGFVCGLFNFSVSTPHSTDFVTLHKQPQHSVSQFSDLQFGNQNRFSLHASRGSYGHLLMSPSSLSSAAATASSSSSASSQLQQHHNHHHHHHQDTFRFRFQGALQVSIAAYSELLGKGSEKRCHKVPSSNSLGIAST